MTVYVKQLNEEFFDPPQIDAFEKRQIIFGYFLDEESCMKDAEAEEAFYSSRGNYTNLFKQGRRIVLNTSVQGSGQRYTNLSFTWSPIEMLELHSLGARGRRNNAEELASEFTGMKRDSKRDYARRGMKRHYERMGMIPSPIGLAAYRRKIEVPKGFKYAQLGFLALVFGALTVNEMRKRE